MLERLTLLQQSRHLQDVDFLITQYFLEDWELLHVPEVVFVNQQMLLDPDQELTAIKTSSV